MTPEELKEFSEMKRRVTTLEHQHAALLATAEKALARITELEKAKASG